LPIFYTIIQAIRCLTAANMFLVLVSMRNDLFESVIYFSI